MSCLQRSKKAAKVASATGIPNLSSQTGAEVGQAGEIVYYLPPEWRKKGSHHPQPLPWPPAGRQRRGFWGNYRQRVKYALEAWRSEADDRTLARLRAELASDLVEQEVARVQSSDHPAGIAGDLAEERAALLLFPSRSISTAERVERVAVLDNAIALLRVSYPSQRLGLPASTRGTGLSPCNLPSLSGVAVTGTALPVTPTVGDGSKLLEALSS
ncbi:MAG: hypothetical protein KJ077_25850 [Anaerolineae bacterium]|nr:hypothetical protein [Anaerolineae bacterium]